MSGGDIRLDVALAVAGGARDVGEALDRDQRLGGAGIGRLRRFLRVGGVRCFRFPVLAGDREIGSGEHRVQANPERSIGERRIARADVGRAELARDRAGEQIAGAGIARPALATRRLHEIELRKIELSDLEPWLIGICGIGLCGSGLAGSDFNGSSLHRIGPCEPASEQIGPVAEAIATNALADLAGA